jgi:hypothetical protein
MTRRSIATWAGAALLLLIIAFLAWKWSTFQSRAEVSAAYGARLTCSCRYVEGRTMDSCRGDLEPGMGMVTLSDDRSAKAVNGRVTLMASRTARYREGFGCLLDP